MKSFMTLYGREDRPGGFLPFAVPIAAAHCTRNKGSTWIAQNHRVSSSYSYSMSHQTLTNTLPALLSSPLPSCTHRHTASAWGTQASRARSQARWHNYELWQMLPLIPFLLQNQIVFQPSILQENLRVRIYFQWLLCFNFLFFLHSISSFLVWIKLTAGYVPGCATQTRTGNELKAPQFQLWHWGSCA